MELPKNVPVEDWSSTFHQVAERMRKLQEKEEAFVFDPAVGTEGLSGSSWVKSRSATEMLLETLLVTDKTVDQGMIASQRCLLEILRTFEWAHQVVYNQTPKTGLIKQASTSYVDVYLEGKGGLDREAPENRHNSMVYLVGWKTLSVPAIMDGMECIHTFDTGRTPVQPVFLIPPDSNWDVYCQETELIDQKGFHHFPPLWGPQVSFSQEDFLTSILPFLMEIDTVIFTRSLGEGQTLVEQVKEKTANIQASAHSTGEQFLPLRVQLWGEESGMTPM
ncbi:LOW QUALITY PROTEIN: glucokinase regulatory protein [Rhynchocyon petersi]